MVNIKKQTSKSSDFRKELPPHQIPHQTGIYDTILNYFIIQLQRFIHAYLELVGLVNIALMRIAL